MMKGHKKDLVAKPETDAGGAGADQELEADQPVNRLEDDQTPAIASARSIPRAGNVLAGPPKGEIGRVRISLVGDPEFAPDLEEVLKVNQRKDSQTRTPLMAVIQAILAKEGGSMTLQQISDLVPQYWNRRFPTSPYSVEQFLYIMATQSDSLRVNW